MDKLEESEAARLEEKKEAEYKPVVMGKLIIFCWFFLPTLERPQMVMKKMLEDFNAVSGLGCHLAVWSWQFERSQPADT